MTVTPPTFVAEYETAWNVTTTPKSVTPTISPGDCLIIAAMTSNHSLQVNTPTDDLATHLTYNPLQTILVTNYCWVQLWSVIVGSQSGAFNLSATRTGSADMWGFNCLRFSGVSGIGVSNKNNADDNNGASVDLTTQKDNSLVVCYLADWNIATGARTWRTVNGTTPTSGNGFEKTFASVSPYYVTYGAIYPNVGPTGTKTFGISAPTAVRHSTVAVELKGVGQDFGSGFFDGI